MGMFHKRDGANNEKEQIRQSKKECTKNLNKHESHATVLHYFKSVIAKKPQVFIYVISRCGGRVSIVAFSYATYILLDIIMFV